MGQAVAAWAVSALISAAISIGVTLLINALTPPIRREGPRLSDLKTQSVDYGTYIPSIYGTYQIAGSVIWFENNRISEAAQTDTIGGKGGPSTQLTKFTYSATLAIAVCEGPIEGIKRIWADSLLVYDKSPGTTVSNVYASGQVVDNITIYKGTEDQLPDARIEASKGFETTAFRGVAYVVFQDFQLEKFGNRIPNFLFEPSTVNADSPAILHQYEPGVVNNIVQHLKFRNLDRDGISNPSIPRSNANWQPVRYSQGGVVYEKQPSQNPSTSPFMQTTLETGMMSLSTGWVVQQNRSVIGWEEHKEQKYFEKNVDYLFTNVRMTTVVRGSPADHTYRIFHVNSNSREKDNSLKFFNFNFFMTRDRDMVAIGVAGNNGNDPDFVNSRDIEKAFLFNETIYTNLGGNGLLRTIIATSTGGGFIGDLYIQGEGAPGGGAANDRGYNKRIGDVFVNEDGVYFTLSPGGTSYDLYKYSHDLTLELGYWPLIDSSQSIASILHWSGGYGNMHVSGNNIVFFGNNGGKILVSTFQFVKFFNKDFIIPTGNLQTDFLASDSPAEAINIGGDAFMIGEAVILAGDLFNGINPTLDQVIEDMANKAGILSEDLDVASLTDEVVGFGITSLQSMSSNIRPLQMAYPFDVVESDWKLKFVKRSNREPIDLDENDLGAYELGATPENLLLHEREEDSKLPRQVNVKFQDYTRNYDIGEQSQTRTTTESDNVWQQDLTLVFQDEDALKIAEVILYASWLERNVFEFTLGMKHIGIEPTDVIDISIDGTVHSIRVQEVDVGRPGLVSCKAVSQDGSNYTSFAQAQAGTRPNINSISFAVASEAKVLDIPLLRDNDETNNPGIYIATYAIDQTFNNASAWGGVGIKATDSATEGVSDGKYIDYGFADQRAVVGELQSYTDLPINRNIVDEANVISISIQNQDDQLESIEQEDFYAGNNIIIIAGDKTDDPDYEIIYFQNAILEVDGTYTLSNLIRGVSGTTLISTAGESLISNQCFIAKPETLNRIAYTRIDSSQFWKAIPSGGYSLDSAPIKGPVVNLQSSMPLSVVHLSGERDVPGDINISWVRRGRLEGNWNERVDVPLSEFDERYEVDILDSATDDLIRTAPVTQQEFDYTLAEQTTDFGTPPAEIKFIIYQISSVAGRGFPAEIVV